MEYRDFIDDKANGIITGLGGTITPAPANPELYRDFLERKFDDVINAIGNFPVIKSFTYTGDNEYSRTLSLPSDLKVILFISSGVDRWGDYDHFQTSSILLPQLNEVSLNAFHTNEAGVGYTTLHYSIVNGELTFYSTVNRHYGLNYNNIIYTVYYI